MSGPLSRVADAIADGAVSRAQIAERTGLQAGVVDAALEHLERLGRFTVEQLAGGCPDGGCGACPSGTRDGRAGCGAAGPSSARGPVLLKLTKRPGA
ncbi:FeoC-like transcriptional regulator [uncultured Tessaracoccus sp.]|uniref:DprA-like winged helix domain-containing protein n=1 Tax=uncultured Tessaracoccus sp. TaxID=905023 RepID=UPI0025CE80C2|nr:FeoC-like transcriptional regulator [uncultured Tessaracoccus sp.]